MPGIIYHASREKHCATSRNNIIPTAGRFLHLQQPVTGRMKLSAMSCLSDIMHFHIIDAAILARAFGRRPVTVTYRQLMSQQDYYAAY